MRENDEGLYVSEKKRCKVWKYYMERIMNEGNDWNHKVEDAVEGPVVCGSREEVLQVINKIKMEKTLDLQMYRGVIRAGGEVGIIVMAEIYQGVLDGFGVPVRWAPSMVVPNFMGKGDIEYHSYYAAVKLLEHF